MRKTILLLLFGFAFTSPPSRSESLCSITEEPVFSFKEKRQGKFASVCKEKDSKYLTYRFGRKEKIELQYPYQLDPSSWNNFTFSGMHRPGGKKNAGFGSYSLSFINGDSEYVLFQEWDDEKGSYVIGINVAAHGKSVTLLGRKDSQEGSLVLLDSERQNIKNQDEE